MYTLKQSVFTIKTKRQNFRSIAVSQAGIKSDGNSGKSKSWKEIPGPSSLPIIGQLLHFLPGGELYKPDINLAGNLFKKYGPITKLGGALGSSTFVFLFDPEAVEHVLRNENHLPIRPGFESLVYFREKNKPKDKPDFPIGLLCDQGEKWKKFRSTVNPALLQPKTIALYRNILNEVADDMVARNATTYMTVSTAWSKYFRLKSKRNEKNMIDGKLDVEMNLWALESIGTVALGGRLNCLDPNLPEDSPSRKIIQVVHDVFEIATKLNFRSNLSRMLSTPMFKKAMQLYKEQIELEKYFLAKAVKEFKKEKKSNDEKGVLEKLLDIDENIAEIMASDMLFAGIDTSSNTIIATLYLLASNQDKQDKLREEILSNEDKRPYLKACLKESMRILPVASANLRKTTKDYNLLGYNIPKGMHIIFCHQIISTQKNQFVRPNEFLPERWIVDKSDSLYYGNAHPFAYMPFGFGARSCIGQRVAELEIQTFLAKIIQNFRLEWFGGPLKVQQTSLNYLRGPYNFIFKDV